MELQSFAQLLGRSWYLLGQGFLASPVLLYLGPETIMPVGSFLAAALGIFLIFWRQAMAFCRSSLKRVFGRKSGSEQSPNLEGRGEDPSSAD